MSPAEQVGALKPEIEAATGTRALDQQLLKRQVVAVLSISSGGAPPAGDGTDFLIFGL